MLDFNRSTIPWSLKKIQDNRIILEQINHSNEKHYKTKNAVVDFCKWYMQMGRKTFILKWEIKYLPMFLLRDSFCFASCLFNTIAFSLFLNNCKFQLGPVWTLLLELCPFLLHFLIFFKCWYDSSILCLTFSLWVKFFSASSPSVFIII